MSDYRLLVTGSRTWADVELLCAALRQHLIEQVHEVLDRRIVLVVGDCPTGADAIATDWAHQLGIPVEMHGAFWRDYGRGAGPRRNQAMVDSGVDWCIAFVAGDSRGTRDCIRRAKAAGVTVTEVVAS